ncbi:MAG: M14 family zinc carboxypeptidase [Candidatus Sumerlaeaceae bacterium]
MNLDLLDQIPDSDRYPNLTEITNHARGLVGIHGFRVQTIGRSRLGREIDLISFGSGEKPTVLLWGFEDPHEPICSLSLMWLCAQLADAHSPIHELGYDWAMIPCLNPDGVARNEHWFQYPGDLRAFLNWSWEDDLAFWGAPEYPEELALEKAIVRTKPELLFAMHDESHYPGHGYWALVSEESVLDGLGEHFEYESRIGVTPILAPVKPQVMKDNWYFGRAHGLNDRCLSMICESRGYRQLMPPRETDESVREQFRAALAEYEFLINELRPSCEEEHALIRCAKSCRERMRQERMFAICVGSCGLRVLKERGNERKAESIENVFWYYLSARLEGTYAPIPIRDQVRIQLHFLFSVIREVERRARSISTKPH